MRLLVQSGAQTGQGFDLQKETTTLGRGSGSDILLTDQAVSRQHAKIQRLTNGFVISDAGGTNGTFVNNVRIKAPTQIHIGDTIRVGQTILLAQESSDLVVPPPQVLHGEQTVKPSASSSSGGGKTPLLALGIGLAAGLLLIGALFIILPNLASTPTETPAATSVSADNSTTAATLGATAPATEGAENTPVATNPSTAQPPPTALAPTVVPTLAPTVAPRGATTVPSPSATATPLNEARNYPPPQALTPKDRAIFGDADLIAFSWVEVPNLESPDYYRIQIARDADFKTIACEIRTRNTSGFIGDAGHRCTPNWEFPNRYFWRLEIVTGDMATGANERVLSVPEAPMHDFEWK